MKRSELDTLSKDAFQEIGNIGSGSAVTALSHLMSEEITGRPTRVMPLECASLPDTFGKIDESAMGILLPFYGDISGMLLFVLTEPFVRELLMKTIGCPANFREMDEYKLSVIQEITNIMASSYFTAISAYAKKQIHISQPAVSIDMLGAMVTDPASWIMGLGQDTVCIENGFYLEEENGVNHLGLMLYQESTCQFLQAVGVTL